ADRTETNPDQAAHRQADRLEHATHFAIATFGDHYPIPGIGALAAEIVDGRERRLAVLEFDTREQALSRLVVDPPENPHGVLALPSVARVHELVGQVTRGREHQQALGVEVEPPDRYPA